MIRYSRVTAILLICFLGSASSLVFGQEKKTPKNKRPNIVFIFSDDHAYQAIGAYGNQFAKTPNIDLIAKQGAIFNNFLVTNSICGPSRASLITGKYSHVNGYRGNEGKFNINQQIFSRLLSQSGYQTAWIGKWHLGTPPGDAFDYWNILPGQGHYYNPDFIDSKTGNNQHEGYVTDIITDLATTWLEKRDEEKPFFLVIGEKATHREWLPDIQDLGAYDDIIFPLPKTFYDDYSGRIAAANQDMTISKTMTLDNDLKVNVDFDGNRPSPDGFIYKRLNTKQRAAYKAYYQDKISAEFNKLNLSGNALTEWKYQRYMRDYLSTANSLDRNIGRVMDYLKKNGLDENTIVIYGSDQGFYMGEHGWFDKRFIYQESLKTPFVIRYPEKIKAGTKIDQHLLNIDWAPTLLEIAGVQVPSDIQGKSFLPILLANGSKEKIRDASYYHYYEFPQPHRVSPHFGVITERYKLIRFYKGQEAWELFDLKEDPNELKNLYSQKKYGKITAGLKTKLNELIAQYQDNEAAQILANEKIK